MTTKHDSETCKICNGLSTPDDPMTRKRIEHILKYQVEEGMLKVGRNAKGEVTYTLSAKGTNYITRKFNLPDPSSFGE